MIVPNKNLIFSFEIRSQERDAHTEDFSSCEPINN